MSSSTSHPIASSSTALPPPISTIPDTTNSHPSSTPNPTHPLEQTTSMPEPNAPVNESDNHGVTTPPVPMCHLRALVISGDSHVFTFEPETTVGRAKELIWSMWPSQWTSPAQPPSPSFLRILHAGRVLSDESTLSSNNLPAAIGPATPTVIHISVRSFSIRAEEDPKKSHLLHPVKSRSRHAAADEEVGGCRCVIM